MSEKDKIDSENNFSLDEANNEYLQNGGVDGLRKKEMKKIVTYAVIFFILGFFASYLFGDGIKNIVLKNDNGKIEDTEKVKVSNDEEIDLSTQTIDKNSLGEDVIVINSQPFGDGIIISNLEVQETVWVTIYEDNEGELGNILGAGVFDKGIYKNEKIELLRGTEGDSTYYVKLLKDDGDRIFDHSKDLPIKDTTTKKDLIATFKTTSGMPR